MCSHVDVLGYGARQPRCQENGVIEQGCREQPYIWAYLTGCLRYILTPLSRSIEKLAADETNQLLWYRIICRCRTLLAELK